MKIYNTLIAIAALLTLAAQSAKAGSAARGLIDFDGRAQSAARFSAMAEAAGSGLADPAPQAVDYRGPAWRTRSSQKATGTGAPGNVLPSTGALRLADFSYDTAAKEFTLRFLTPEYENYWGTRVQITVELVQDGLLDLKLDSRVYEFPLNWNLPVPAISFSEADFLRGGDEAAGRARDKKFYVKWGFRVVRDEYYSGAFMKMGRSATVSVPQ